MPQDQFIHCIGDSTKNTLTNPANNTRTLFTPSLIHQSTTITADTPPKATHINDSTTGSQCHHLIVAACTSCAE
jgi:hypothetical protein